MLAEFKPQMIRRNIYIETADYCRLAAASSPAPPTRNDAQLIRVIAPSSVMWKQEADLVEADAVALVTRPGAIVIRECNRLVRLQVHSHRSAWVHLILETRKVIHQHSDLTFRCKQAQRTWGVVPTVLPETRWSLRWSAATIALFLRRWSGLFVDQTVQGYLFWWVRHVVRFARLEFFNDVVCFV